MESKEKTRLLTEIKNLEGRLELTLRESQRLFQSAFDALSAHIAILDEQGGMIAVNAPWRRFATANYLMMAAEGVGWNYLRLCETAVGEGAEAAHALAAGIKQVISKEQDEFTLEYPCHSPTAQRWFIVRVTRFEGEEEGSVRVVVAHEDMTDQKRAEEAHQRLASIVESSNDAIIGMNLDGTVVTWNPGAAQIYGYSADEILGASVSILVPPEHPDRVDEILERIGRGERIDPYETVRMKKDGTRIDVSVTTSPIRDAEGKIVGASSITRDISRRRAAERERRKLSSVIEQTDDVVVITDRDGVIEYVNPAFERKTGYTREEAVGKTPRIVKSGKHGPEFYNRLWETILRGEVFRGELVNQKKDGALYHEEKTITPIKNRKGEITHYVSTGKDMTPRKEMEAALEKARAATIEKERLESIRALSMTYAHNILNAITPVRSYAELIVRRTEPSDPKVKWAQAIIDGTGEVVRIIRKLEEIDRYQTTEQSGIKLFDVDPIKEKREK
ncbi:MAG: PAS domain S-box protein [Candidatus Manganitrophus sp.]|nr:MAG: PAS domain S-box protein [Candidatus Manganitrophus sp.]WDT78623.1 MAG: PAS domain S-box protein [Candidatus Manganitrophus sp.]